MAKRKQQSEAERTAIEAALLAAAEKTAAQPVGVGRVIEPEMVQCTCGDRFAKGLACISCNPAEARAGVKEFLARYSCSTCGGLVPPGEACPTDGQVN
jgi:hypothetical protein